MINRIIIILNLILLISCSNKINIEKPRLEIKIEPISNVYIQYDSQSNIFRMGNELIERQIRVNKEKRMVFTISFINKLSGLNYIKSLGEEFSFRANGVKISGISGDLQLVNYVTSGAGGVEVLEMHFQIARKETGILNIKIIYEAFYNMPVIRKWLEIENSGGSSVKIDSIQMESLNMVPGSAYNVKVYDKSESKGNIIESLSPIVFNTSLNEGFRLFNEAPGLLKHNVIDPFGGSISIGMKPHFQNYAPEIQIGPKEKFVSPVSFILLFKDEIHNSNAILEKFLLEFLLTKKPAYSVWYENIANNVELDLLAKLQLAKKSGADIFCLDGDWMDKRGDWIVKDNINAPNLKNEADKLGIRLGVSLDISIVDLDSQILSDHSVWIAKSKDGSDYITTDGKMMCLASQYALYMSYELEVLVKELKLDYIIFTGSIIPEAQPGGCFALEHLHRSSGESLWYIYEGLFAICRYLRNKHPNLIIQISPKSYNPEGDIDYPLLKYTDTEWPFYP